MHIGRRSVNVKWLLGLGSACLLASVLLAGCAAPSEPAEIKSDKQRKEAVVTTGETADLVAGNSAFAFDLYQALRGQGGNLFYSPYSISLALAMTYAGAANNTEGQMADTLHYTLPGSQLHPTFNALDTTLTSYGDEEDAFQLNIANAIWGQKGYQFLQSFLDVLAENYGAGLRTLDFVDDTEEARFTINQWVSDQTEEKIQNLLAPGVLRSDTRLVLTNAIYFKGKWIFPFEESATHDDIFTTLDGSTVSVPMMTQTETFRYTEGDGYQAATLPYQGANMSMLLVLPEEGRFEEVESAFSDEFVGQINGDLGHQSVALSVPKFSFESEVSLSKTLAEMGMADAFGPEADFSGMTGDRDLFISDVVHKAFVAVDEAGTEAAAATAVVMAEMAAMIDEPVEMRLDRPFLFLIRDDDTGAILFVGRVLNPE